MRAGVVQPVSVMCVDEHGNPLRGLAPDNVCIRITLHDRSNTAHHVTVTAGCVTVNNGKLSFEYTVEKRLVVSMKVPLTLDIEVVVLGVTAVRANIPVRSKCHDLCHANHVSCLIVKL